MRYIAPLLLILPGLSFAQQSSPARDLHVDGIYATTHVPFHLRQDVATDGSP